eukprot:1163732-Prymnesium_polylepis.1
MAARARGVSAAPLRRGSASRWRRRKPASGMQLWRLVDRTATPLTALYSWVVSASHADSQAYRRAPTMSAHHLL